MKKIHLEMSALLFTESSIAPHQMHKLKREVRMPQDLHKQLSHFLECGLEGNVLDQYLGRSLFPCIMDPPCTLQVGSVMRCKQHINLLLPWVPRNGCKLTIITGKMKKFSISSLFYFNFNLSSRNFSIRSLMFLYCLPSCLS